MHFKIRNIGGQKYLYLIKNRRVNGKIKQVIQKSLGTADKLYEKVTTREKPKVASFSFGKVAALIHAAEKTGFMEAAEKHTKRRKQEGLSVG